MDPKLIGELLAKHGHRPRDTAGEKGLLKQLAKRLLERALQAGMTEHLGFPETADRPPFDSARALNRTGNVACADGA